MTGDGSALLAGAKLELDTQRQVLRLTATSPLATPPDLVIRYGTIVEIKSADRNPA